MHVNVLDTFFLSNSQIIIAPVNSISYRKINLPRCYLKKKINWNCIVNASSKLEVFKL